MPPKAAAGVPPEVAAARAKLKAKFAAQSGGGDRGAGASRRTKVSKHQNSGADEKQLQQQLKKLGVNNIPGIEEVNMFKEDGSVLHFAAPKVQASVQSNTYVVAGHGEIKQLQELLPGIINQLGPDNLANLKRIAEGYAAAEKKGAAKEGDDDDVPDIGESSFEEVSKN